jgi:hypothetical protein
MDAAAVAQIASAVFTALAALAALLTVRLARDEMRVARDSLEAETQPIVTDVPRGLFTEEIEWHNLDGTISMKRQDRAEVSVGTSGPEPISSVSVPVRNVGNGPARVGEVTFVSVRGESASGWVGHPVLPSGELTHVGLSAGPNDPGSSVAESIGMAYEDFAVVIDYADASGNPRETVRLHIANGEHPRVTDRRWDGRASDSSSDQPSGPAQRASRS